MELPIAHRWFLSRADRACLDAVDALFPVIGERLAIATAAAVSVRLLSVDGAELVPVGAYHPDPQRATAMLKVMADTVQPAHQGFWGTALREGRPVRWHLPDSRPPDDASDRQAAFITEHTITAVLGAPLRTDGGRTLGGVALVRYGARRPFGDDDEALLLAAGRRLGPVLELLRTLHLDGEGDGDAGSPSPES